MNMIWRCLNMLGAMYQDMAIANSNLIKVQSYPSLLRDSTRKGIDG